jgi:hypothetical protein
MGDVMALLWQNLNQGYHQFFIIKGLCIKKPIGSILADA